MLGLEPETKVCKIAVGLYDEGKGIGEPIILPTVSTKRTHDGTTAMIGAKQNFPQ